MALNLTSVYLHVVDDVISNVRADFHSDGVDDGVLNELQSLWELKMMQSGAIQATTETSFARGINTPITPVHDLNVPYEATEEYQTPTAEMLFPPTPIQTPLQEPFMYHYLPPGPSESAEAGISGDVKLGRPAPYMQLPTQWVSQRPVGVDVNIAYDESRDGEAAIGQPVTKDFFTLSAGKRKREDFGQNYLSGNYFPQQDGAEDVDILPPSVGKAAYSVEQLKESLAERGFGRSVEQWIRDEKRPLAHSMTGTVADSQQATNSSNISQFDGVDDNFDGVADKYYNEPGEEEGQATYNMEVKVVKAGAESDGSELPLNEDDDDDPYDPNDLDGGDSIKNR